MSEEEKTQKAVTEEPVEETADSADWVAGVYELGFLLKSSLSDEEVSAQVEEFKNILAEVEAEIIDEGLPKMQALAYVMEIPRTVPKERYDHAHFGWIKAELSTSVAKKVEDRVSRQPAVIRYLLIRTSREDTLSQPKVPTEEKVKPAEPIQSVSPIESSGSEVSSESATPKQPVDEDEIDKSIEDLIAE